MIFGMGMSLVKGASLIYGHPRQVAQRWRASWTLMERAATTYPTAVEPMVLFFVASKNRTKTRAGVLPARQYGEGVPLGKAEVWMRTQKLIYGTRRAGEFGIIVVVNYDNSAASKFGQD